MLIFGYWYKLERTLQNHYVAEDFYEFIRNSYNPINWSLTDIGKLYVCYDNELDKIVALMEINKQVQKIFCIESRFTGNNYAMKMINYFDKKFKTKLQPVNIMKEAEEYWKKKGYII